MQKPSVFPQNIKTKVIVLAGFLGAGKTTLLKRILSWETDLSGTVVIVNEFGAVGIDGSLLTDAGSDVVELTSGCVCCSLQADLTLTLKKIRQQFNPSRIIIEATGVADPRAIVDVFQDAELQEYMAVDKIITVLDADFWEVRECLGTLFFSHVIQWLTTMNYFFKKGKSLMGAPFPGESPGPVESCRRQIGSQLRV